MLPLVSIVMPSYNAEEHLKEAINSILNQTFKNFEFIIINDGSTDRTEEIILSYKDERIRYFKNESNIKLIASLNKGFKLAFGKYIARMDADDISMPKRLEKQVEFMEQNLDVGISGGQMELFGATTGSTDYPLTHNKCLIRLLDQTCFSNNLFIIRRELVHKYNFSFDKNYLHTEDYKFYTDVLQKIKGANLPDILTKYRKHDGSVTANNFVITLQNRRRVRVEHLTKLTCLSESIIEQFYQKISLSRFFATRTVKKILLKNYNEEEQYINQVIIERVWYKDALYESESSIKPVFTYSFIYLSYFNKTTILNGVNVFKHYIKKIMNNE